MKKMLIRKFPLALVVLIMVVTILAGPSAAQRGAGSSEILRDEFGVPHIFAATLEDAAFAIGYAQAEDRLEELLRNYRKAEGTMAEAFGPEWYRHDYTQRMWRHAEIARERYNEVSPKMRACLEAYQEGIKRYMKEHPGQAPAWAPELHPAQIVSLGRYIIWGWPMGEAGGDLRRGGIEPDPVAYRGSNQMLLAPFKTAMNAPYAVIDPHLGWYGEFRFYEVRIYAGDFAVSGVSILGIPFPSLGHSRWASVAMTTGGPDTSDIYEEETNPADPRQYRHDDQWLEMNVRKDRIRILDGGKIKTADIEIEYTRHGPVVARKGEKAYSMAIPYFNEVGLTDQIHEMFTSRNLAEMKKAISKLQLMAQNVMVGTVDGDIYYVRNGRVPIRPDGCDPSKPMPGNTSKCDWKGLHSFDELVQIANPPQGYMQNNNISPYAMMKDSPLRAEKYAKFPYIYNAQNAEPHQRGAMTLEQLDAAKKVTVEQMIDIAFSPEIFRADRWQARLKQAWEAASNGPRSDDASKVQDLIRKWNRRSDADSTGALAFYAFKMNLGSQMLSRSVDVPDSIRDEQLIKALDGAAGWLKKNFGSLEVPYGRYFRVGREGGKTWPVAGGTVTEAGMATPRAITFGKVGDEMVGRGGQTSTQVVILTKTPKSFTILPLGQSDHMGSGHWDDQAEKLFSRSRMKSTFFLDRAGLEKIVTARKKLERVGKGN
ncbi:MAG: penicillin acylase family protein [Acidobacteriota bacterium]|nr:MAG: penicillin acylase family protein [Acidobacteriota bacterium]